MRSFLTHVALGLMWVLMMASCSNQDGSSSSGSSESSSSTSSSTNDSNTGSWSGNTVIGITTPPTGYLVFSALSSLQRGYPLKLRLNRTGTRIDEYTVYFDSLYSGGERLVLLNTGSDLFIGAGDSGSPVLTSDGKVVAALCYGWRDNKRFFAARAIEDLLALQNLPSALREGALKYGNFEQLGLSGSAVKLRQGGSFFSSSYSSMPDLNSEGFKAESLLRSSSPTLSGLQPGNTIAIAERSMEIWH